MADVFHRRKELQRFRLKPSAAAVLMAFAVPGGTLAQTTESTLPEVEVGSPAEQEGLLLLACAVALWALVALPWGGMA